MGSLEQSHIFSSCLFGEQGNSPFKACVHCDGVTRGKLSARTKIAFSAANFASPNPLLQEASDDPPSAAKMIERQDETEIKTSKGVQRGGIWHVLEWLE